MYALLTLFFMFHGTSSNYEIHKYFLKILSKSKLSCYTYFLKIKTMLEWLNSQFISKYSLLTVIFSHLNNKQ